MKLTIPNGLSLCRIPLAVLSFAAIYGNQWRIAAVVMLLAVCSDMLDGDLARRRRQVTILGGLLDHLCDAIFVTATLAALALRSVVPFPLPLLVAGAFTQYALDSNALSGEPLRASRLGRYNGLAYYVLAGLPSMQHALGLHPVPESWFWWLGWALATTTVASMTDRLVALGRIRRRGPSSPR